ncbi:MAG TPA: alpha/beta fold hydrolase [Bryobacteraceae bacterium]
MGDDFQPIFGNAHLLTLAGNFWPRKIDERRFPAIRREYKIAERVTVIALEHRPLLAPGDASRGEIVLLHGLEGSSEAGYIASFAQEALTRGFGIHRLNMRTCGGTETLCETMYHSGLTSDTKFVLEQLQLRGLGTCFLVGFSLGGNVALKLAGELGQTDLLTGVCAVSTPVDLAASVLRIDKPLNILYVRRFLERLRERVRRMSELYPHLYNTAGLDDVKSIWEFDDRFTAPLFGFGTAANYYATQSAVNYLDAICIPTLVICAKDDPLISFAAYSHAAFKNNPALTLLATEKGGHLGYMSRHKPRFWLDRTVLNWLDGLASKPEAALGSTLSQA